MWYKPHLKTPHNEIYLEEIQNGMHLFEIRVSKSKLSEQILQPFQFDINLLLEIGENWTLLIDLFLFILSVNIRTFEYGSHFNKHYGKPLIEKMKERLCEKQNDTEFEMEYETYWMN